MSKVQTSHNKLKSETSPYLLQHAENPVNWWPWCEAAFEEAKASNKPIFLSSGYSTCHWCHVMAYESFEDEKVAEILNENFVSIKLDREERPDVDAVYMEVCQALTGSGGWPLTVMMTPDKKPFFAGTYFPKERKYGRTGFIEILENIVERWKADSAGLISASEEISGKIIARNMASYEGDISDIDLKKPIRQAVSDLTKSFDKNYGGFGRAPKFPSPHILSFLMRYYLKEKNEHALEMVRKTLEQMYRGGIFDHIGFGFSRYSVDDKWLAPHFEKMLYDNALLAAAYLECYMICGEYLYRDIALKVLEYIKREMTSPEGAFYSAQDADSDGVEGKYYLWSKSEIKDVLGFLAGTRFCNTYGITRQGNFEGENIANLIHARDLEEIEGIDNMREKLYEYRLKRYHLHKDDKILTSWNALMISAYAKAYKATGDEEYMMSAHRALEFLENYLIKDGELYVSYRKGLGNAKAMLDDYAFLCSAYISMYEAAYEHEYMDKAEKLLLSCVQKFEGSENGGFFLSGYSAGDSGELLFRPKEIYDGAMPSGNSILISCFAKLAAYTGDSFYSEKFDSQLEFFMGRISRYPKGHTAALMGVMDAAYPRQKLVCVFRNNADYEDAKAMFSRRFDPFSTIILRMAEDSGEYILPEGKDKAFYLCAENACRPPVFSLEEALRACRQ